MEPDKVQVITKSPGKVLVCGGYVIISPNFQGLVLTTDTFFTCKSELISKEKLTGHGVDYNIMLNFKVASKEYNQIYEYKINIEQKVNDRIEFVIYEYYNKNDFLKYALLMGAYFFIFENVNKKELEKSIWNGSIYNYYIDMEADYRFYSYDSNNVNTSCKNGLGSSSAMVASLVTNISLLLTRSMLDRDYSSDLSFSSLPIEKRAYIELSSLIANNFAQNKVTKIF
jgi:phosphomevalonate kinase